MEGRPPRRGTWEALAARGLAVCAVAAGAVVGGAPREISATAFETPAPPIAVCFAPGTSELYVDDVSARLAADPRLRYFAPGRWSFTATDGFVFGRGGQITLTWNVVADGVAIPDSGFSSAGTSNLRKTLNGIYGGESVWMPLFERVFARWGELTGVTYVRETADDGAALSSASGSPGVRADVRIGGKEIDGDYGVLAYNAFPNDGDMVLDTNDAWFRSTSFQSRGLRNVVSHEHGHGLGLDHVCPLRGSKLMEPNVSLGFDGPQLDDVLGAQRLYGDDREPNDTRATATDLGPAGSVRKVVETVSTDGSNDSDVYGFSAPDGAYADVIVTPTGREYDHAAELADGGCGKASQRFDARKRSDLDVAVLRADGTEIASADATPLGGQESLLDVALDRGAGQYFVRVRGGTEDDVQPYRLELRVVQRGEKPAAAADAATTFEVLPVAVDVLSNDTGLADEPLRIRVVERPANARALIAGGRVVYVPRRGFSGEDRFVYEVTDVHRQTSMAEAHVAVTASAQAGNARTDADGDGYPDEFETFRGTGPGEASSLPGEPLPAGPAPLPVTSVILRTETRVPERDEIRIRGRLPVAAEFAAEGADKVVVSIAGVAREIPLDATGRATGDAAGTFRLRVRRRKGVVVAGDAVFDLVLRRGDFAASWADEGLLADRRQRGEPRAATLIALFGGRTYSVTVPLVWTADAGRRGTARRARGRS